MSEFPMMLNQPFVTTLLTLIVGGYLFGRITERRARKDKIREQAIEFLEEAGNDMNWVLSRLYGRIRTKSFGMDATIDEKRRELFTKRFSVRIKSKAYLKSDEFWEKYESLTFEIDRIVRFIGSHSTADESEKLLAEIQRHQQRVVTDWPLTGEMLDSKRDPPWNELENWVMMVWNRAVLLLTRNLEAVMR